MCWWTCTLLSFSIDGIMAEVTRNVLCHLSILLEEALAQVLSLATVTAICSGLFASKVEVHHVRWLSVCCTQLSAQPGSAKRLVRSLSRRRWFRQQSEMYFEGAAFLPRMMGLLGAGPVFLPGGTKCTAHLLAGRQNTLFGCL